MNSKGQSRLEKITISIVHYGFEPDIFKSAFRQGWSRFDQPGIDDKRQIKDKIVEQDSNSQGSDREEGKTTSEGLAL